MPDHYRDTLRLARLIGLDHITDGHSVWRRDRPHHSVPWRPFECGDDLEPIAEWLNANDPEWINREDWRLYRPEPFCRAVLDAFDRPEPEPLTPAECEVALAELAERLDALQPDTVPDSYAGWTVVDVSVNGGVLLRSSAGHRRRVWFQAAGIERLRTELEERTHQHRVQLDNAVRLTREVERLKRTACDSALDNDRLSNLHDASTKALMRVQAERDRLRTDLATARDTNRRLNRRCQAAEAMATEYNRAANYFRAVGRRIEEQAETATWWLERLRKTVRAAEAAEGEE